MPPPKTSIGSRAPAILPGSHLGGHAVKILPQHPPHVLPGVGCHLMLQQKGELAALADAVEVAVHLVVLAAWRGNGKDRQLARAANA